MKTKSFQIRKLAVLAGTGTLAAVLSLPALAQNDRIWMGDVYIPNPVATDSRQTTEQYVASSKAPVPARVWMGDVYIPNLAATNGRQTKQYVASSKAPVPARIWMGDVYIPNPAATDAAA
jgi:hypothetical protein